MNLIVIPVHGKDFINSVSALDSWNANEDWIILDTTNRCGSKHINKVQAKHSGYKVVLRYNKERNTTPVVI